MVVIIFIKWLYMITVSFRGRRDVCVFFYFFYINVKVSKIRIYNDDVEAVLVVNGLVIISLFFLG